MQQQLKLLAAVLLLLLLAAESGAWRLPVLVRPRGSPLQAAVYSSSGRPPLIDADGGIGDGSSVPLGPVATPPGYKFIPYDGEAISRLAVQQWWRVLARLNEVGLPILRWYSLVRSDEVR